MLVHSSGDWKSKVKVRVRLGKGSLLSGRLLLYLHMVEEAKELEISFINTNPIDEGSSFMT